MKPLLDAARAGRYAVPAINVGNYETVCAVLEAAEAERAPVIIQIYQRLVDHGHATRLAPLIRTMAEHASVPVALHLDHGETLAQVMRTLRDGFSSGMSDASTRSLADNIAAVRQVVELAHPLGVCVEAELGHVPSAASDEIEAGFTDPDEAADFVRETGIDALAVAVGTAHGIYKKTPALDFDRLERIARVVDVPLVLHGGSCTPDEALWRTIELGITKINIATEYQHLFLQASKVELERLDGKFRPVDLFMKPVMEQMVAFVRSRLQLFVASGRA
jgi:fructose-bisphosphate aldolase class II